MKNAKDLRGNEEAKEEAKKDEVKLVIKRLKIRSAVHGGVAISPESADAERCC
jgi:hypothetical protein